jgi:hypothetical protein
VLSFFSRMVMGRKPSGPSVLNSGVSQKRARMSSSHTARFRDDRCRRICMYWVSLRPLTGRGVVRVDERVGKTET